MSAIDNKWSIVGYKSAYRTNRRKSEQSPGQYSDFDKSSHPIELESCSNPLKKQSTRLSGVQRSGDARGDCLIDWMPPYQILVLSSVAIVTGYTLFVTSYSRLRTNVLMKFVDTTCIFRDAGAAVGKQSRRHGGTSVGLAPTNKSPIPPN